MFSISIMLIGDNSESETSDQLSYFDCDAAGALPGGSPARGEPGPPEGSEADSPPTPLQAHGDRTGSQGHGAQGYLQVRQPYSYPSSGSED